MSRHYALLPAAGVGARMGVNLPKQYLDTAGRPLLWHALRVFEAHTAIDAIYVVLSPEDGYWDGYDWSEFGKLKVLRCGGATRAESVLNGLTAMVGEVGQDDWVLVHDAARPCLSARLLERLIEAVAEDGVGGILAAPVADTLKREGEGRRIRETVPRAGLWGAQTPQMFRHGLLKRALEQAGTAVTDEASAVEALGQAPRLVEGDITNLKVTYPRDLELAALILQTPMPDRGQELQATQGRLEYLVEMGLAMSMERDRMALLRKILFGGCELLNCDAGTFYLVTEQGTLRFAMITNDIELPYREIPLHDPVSGAANDHYAAVYAAVHNRMVAIDDVAAETRFDLSGTRRYDAASGYHTVSMLTVPLAPRDGEVIGVLQFINALDPVTGAVTRFSPELSRFVSAMASQAAVALDNHQLVEALERLMDALIRLLAGAIDAKSAYTGGHCERVPELAFMLAEEACKVETGPLAEFRFASEEEWREFRIGAWLHDCGKVTTPEYVVDKATKLETLYNRIHEIRTRFEVLLRDAEIECLRARLAGEDAEAAERRLADRKAQLQDDYAFVAACNQGGEVMAPERAARLQAIAARTWQRHFDDRLGLSQAEENRIRAVPAPTLPVVEQLLADKPEHIIPRGQDRQHDPRHGFQVQVPEHLYNLGEVYNLSVGRGTLTPEERYKINEHIIQTIVMLDGLPYPKNLRRVPEYAGTHHETLDGTGYPRRLGAGQLSVPARIMAIADIFEALTASDRPYKKAKTLSQAVAMLADFKQQRHIDADLFELFLRSGVYRRYGERFLSPEQNDAVDIERYLG